MPRLLGVLLLLSALTGSVILAQEPKKEPELTKEERAKLEAEALRLNQEGLKFSHAAQLPEAEKAFRQALRIRQKLYRSDQYPEGHPELAVSLNNLAGILQEQGQLIAAEALCHQALMIQRKHYPPNRYPDGHPYLAHSLNNLGMVLKSQGRLSQAELLLRETLLLQQKIYPIDRFPNGHSQLSRSMHNLAGVLFDLGNATQAEKLYRQALLINQKLYPTAHYPNGHPHTAQSLNHLARVIHSQGQYSQAESLYSQALEMRRKIYSPDLFPHGHPDLAISMNNLALLLHCQREYVRATSLFRQAMTMLSHMYPPARFPDGHPNLTQCINNLAAVLHDQGQLAQAEPLYRQALAMRQKLYPPAHFPNGHSAIAGNLHNLALVFYARGNYTQAERLMRQAMEMYWGLMVRNFEARDEGEALSLLATQPGSQEAYLSIMHQRTSFTDSGYAFIWKGRKLITRFAEQQRPASRIADMSQGFRQQFEELSRLKRQRAHLLLAPVVRDPTTAEARAKLLDEWARKIHQLSAQVREALPGLQVLQRLDNSTPADLQKALLKDVVFVDLLQYTYFEYDPQKPGAAGEKRTLRYVAFIVSKEQVQRVDLGPAEPLEGAVKQWRECITTKNNKDDSKAPAALRRLLWEPLEKHFPPGTKTVYLCPDQQLCFLPWGALPGRKADTVLLEDYSLAIVPHGPYLLGQLLGSKEKENKKVDLLVLGGVKYDDAPVQATVAVADRGPDDPKAAPVQAVKGGWPYLKGTATEAETIQKLAEKRQLKTAFLRDKEAGAERFKQELPKARMAHLATHGFFADPKFRSVFQLDEKLFVMRGNERVGAGALLPSLLSGLVFAGANRPETPGRGIVTAEELFDLDLTSMELAVLSACETGLGDVGGGEGVFGLQRAFHVVGCQNVIASLWKVNDVATMVLMEEFYRNLWEKRLSKREALRQAQLTVYRNPEMVLRRAKEMGVRGIEDEAPTLPAAGPATTRRSPPAWWAAFLLSGLGE